MTNRGTQLRSLVLAALVVGSVVAVGGTGLATNASTTTVNDPGGNAPQQGESQTVLNLTVTSEDSVVSAGVGAGTAEAGDATAAFDPGTASSPEMYVDDGTPPLYTDEDDVVLIERERNGPSAVDAGGDGLADETLRRFGTDVEYADPAGDGYDDDEAIVRKSGNANAVFGLDGYDTVVTSGTGGSGLTAFGSQTVWYDTDDGATSGVGGYDGDPAYDRLLSTSIYSGEPIYDEGPTPGLGNDPGETRIAAIEVVRGTDGDNNTIDAGLRLFTDLQSGDADTSKSLETTAGGWLLAETTTGGATGSWDPGTSSENDALVWDTDGSGDISGNDLLVYEESGSMVGRAPGQKLYGDESFDQVTDISGSAQLGFDGSGTDDSTYQAGDVVFVDPQGNGATGIDVALDATGSPKLSTETGTNAFTALGGGIKLWDAPLTTEDVNFEDGFFVDTDGDGQTSAGDVRVGNWYAELEAGTTVDATDTDALIVGTDTQSDWGDDRFVDARNPGSDALDAPLKEAIVDTGGTNTGSLETDDTVLTAGEAGLSGFSAPAPTDGTTGRYYVDQGNDGSGGDATSTDTSGYDDGDDIVTVHTESVGSSAASLDGATLRDFRDKVGYVDGVTTGTNAAGVSSDDAYDGGGSTNADVEAIFVEGDQGTPTPTFGEGEPGQFGDAVTALTVSNGGSLSNGDIDSVALYRGDSRVVATGSPRHDGAWVLDAPTGTAAIGPDGTTFEVRAALASDAAPGETLDFAVDAESDDGDDAFQSGESGLFFAQDVATGSLANGAAITVVRRPDSSSGGGPPSGSATAGEGTLRVSITNADAGDPLAVGLPDSAAMRETGVAMERLNVTLARDGNADFDIDTMVTPGYATPDDTVPLFGYRVTDNLQPADIDRATIRLRVDRDRVDDPDAVQVLRWTDPGWERVDATLADRNDTALAYDVTTTAFSLFAVVESSSANATPTATPGADATATGTVTPDRSPTSEPASESTPAPSPTATPSAGAASQTPTAGAPGESGAGSATATATTGAGPGFGVLLAVSGAALLFVGLRASRRG